MKKVLVVAGLTASGKSDLGIQLAQELNGEIISADSVAVYRGLDIGSAKVPIEERSGIPHHLVDVYDYDQSYNVATFQMEARKLIDDIHSRGKLPIVVGGTGLYINALIYDYRFEEEDKEVDEPVYLESNVELYQKLLELSPKVAEDIHPNNRKRVIRAIERLHKQETEPVQFDKNEALYDALVFFLQGDRTSIYKRINIRVDKMFEQGLLQEVTSLYLNDLSFYDYQASQSIGYREFEAFYKEGQSLDDTIDLIKRNTRRFAKRQITWFKHQTKNITIDVFEPPFKENVLEMSKEWVKKTTSPE